jgi:DNA-binding beta-propeller fold protein YncE
MRSRGVVGWARRSVGVGVAVALVAVVAAPSVGATPTGPTAYVTNSQLASVSVFHGATFGGMIKVGNGPVGIAVDPHQTRAYVADFGYFGQPSDTVTPINLATGRAGTPITVGVGPMEIEVSPVAPFALVTLEGTAQNPGHQVQLINLLTRAVAAPVEVGLNPESIAIAPDGRTAYVGALGSAQVTPVDITRWRAEKPIRLPGTAPRAIAISPDGATAYVLDAVNATIIPIDVASRHVGVPVDLRCQAQGDPGCTPDAIVISPDGGTAYVAAAGSGDMIVLSLPSLSLVGVVQTGAYPDALGLNGNWLYVANGASNTMTVFSGLATPQTVSGVTYPFGVAVVPGSGADTPGAPAIVRWAVGAPAVPSAGAPHMPGPTHPSPFYGLLPPG